MFEPLSVCTNLDFHREDTDDSLLDHHQFLVVLWVHVHQRDPAFNGAHERKAGHKMFIKVKTT